MLLLILLLELRLVLHSEILPSWPSAALALLVPYLLFLPSSIYLLLLHCCCHLHVLNFLLSHVVLLSTGHLLLEDCVHLLLSIVSLFFLMRWLL